MPEKNTKAGREADMMATAFPDGHYPEHTAVLVEIGKLLHEKQAFRMSNVRDRLWNYYHDCGKIMLMDSSSPSIFISDYQHAPPNPPVRWWREICGKLLKAEDARRRWAIETKRIDSMLLAICEEGKEDE